MLISKLIRSALVLFVFSLFSSMPAEAQAVKQKASSGLSPTGLSTAPVSFAGSLPDTIFVKSEPTSPGGLLKLTFEVHLHTEKIGGIFMGVKGLPAGVEALGEEWYSWTENFGKPLADAAIAAFPKFTDGLVSVVIAGVNVAPLEKYGILKSTSGEILSCTFQVPEDAATGVFQLEPTEHLNLLLPWPITEPKFIDFPVVIIDPVVIKKPDIWEKWDFNKDGVASISDVLLFLAELNKLEEGGFSAELDWNDDGVCSPADAADLYRVIRANTVSTAVLASDAGTLPDTIYIKSEPVYPGEILKLTFEASLHTQNVGGLFMGIQNLPPGVKPVDDEWYSWTEKFGRPLSDAALAAFPDFDEASLVSVVIAGVNVAPLKKYGILKTTSGAILHCFLQVPEDAAAGVFQPEPAQQLNMILPWPITDPQFAQLPVVVIEPIEIIDVAQKPEEKKWDFNNDGVPSISDVLWFLSELNSLSEYSAALDWNDDGVCDAADAVVLYQVIRDNTVSSVMLAAALESTAPGAELAKWSTEKKGAVLEMVKQMNLAQADEAALCSLLKVTKKKKPRLSRKYLIQK